MMNRSQTLSILKNLPRNTWLTDYIAFLQNNINSIPTTTISGEEVGRLVQFEGQLQTLQDVEEPQIRFFKFKPGSFIAGFTTKIRNAYQIPRPMFGESSQFSKNPKKSASRAKEEASQHVMLELLGEQGYIKEKRIYQSNVDLLYGYSFKNGYRKPRLYTTRTHTAPQRSTAIIVSDLVQLPGVISLRSEEQQSYGAALLDTCRHLESMLKGLELLSLDASNTDVN